MRSKIKKIKQSANFTKLQLTLFAVVFGMIGGYVIWSSLAANPNLPGDLNNDNTVNVTDLSILLSDYGTNNATADINVDGTVNVLDLSTLLSHYGQSITIGSVPAIPTGLTATAGDGSVTLNWNANASSDQVDSYQVYLNDANYNLNVTGTSLTVTGLTNGTSYTFRVSAHNSAGYGNWTAAVSATPQGAGGGGGSGVDTSSYDAAISYSAAANRPAFTPTRHITVTNSTQLLNALSNLQAGDYIENTQPGGFTVSGQVTISKNLASTAVIDFKTGADAVKFVGNGNSMSSSNATTVDIDGSSNLRIYGGEITNNRIVIFPSTNVTWWNFYAHDLAGDGIDLFPNGGNLNGIDVQGEVAHWGLNCQVLDPHTEKCTGIHAMNMSDSTGSCNNVRVALYAHDGASGAAIELGSETGPTTNSTFYLKANNLTMAAQSQVAGNGFQIWGSEPFTNVKFNYVEVSNAEGRAIDTNGIEGGVSYSGITVVYGRATNTNENPLLSSTRWDTRGGIIYQDVSPLP